VIKVNYLSNIDKLDINTKNLYLKSKKYIDSEILKGKCFYTDLKILNHITLFKRYFAKQVASYVSDSRYFHSISVANLAYKVALSNNLDPYKAYMGGYYHDIGRNDDLWRKYYPLVEKENLKYFPGDIPDYMYHQFTAIYILKDKLKINDPELVEMIKYHTSGNKDMSIYAKIIFAADKIEPTRNFDSTKLVDNLILDANKGFKMVLKANKEYLDSINCKDHNQFIDDCYNMYLKGVK